MIQFRKQGKYSDDADLNRRLVALETEVDSALRALDAAKVDRFIARESSQAEVTAEYGDLWLLDTTAQAIVLYLPVPSIDRQGQRVAVVRRAAAFAVTVQGVQVSGGSILIDAASTATPATGAMVVYELDGEQWWSR